MTELKQKCSQSIKVRFVTKIWHPNISSVTGAICLDILKDQWAAAMTLRTVLLSLQALLAAPEPDDPQDAVVARQYRLFFVRSTYFVTNYLNQNMVNDFCSVFNSTSVDLLLYRSWNFEFQQNNLCIKSS